MKTLLQSVRILLQLQKRIEIVRQTCFILFLIQICTVKAVACSCNGISTVSGNFNSSDIVFSGVVISKVYTTNYDSLGIVETGDTGKIEFNWRKYPSAVVLMKVNKVFKGNLVSDTLTIITPPNSASCEYNFTIGNQYIVYATIYSDLLFTYKHKLRTFDNKTFWTHQCTRTMEWNKSEETEIRKEIK